jgi:signal peptidase II
VTFAIVLADQATKLLVKGFTLPLFNYYHQGMQAGQSIPVIGDFLRITFIENPAMAMGIDIGSPLYRTIFTLAVSLGLLYYIYHIRKEPFIIRLTLAMILGGAIGNLIDRIFYGVIFGEGGWFYGKVVDFIDMDFFDINFMSVHMDRFAIFNVADTFISVGIVMLLLFHQKFSKAGKQVADGTNGETKTEPGSSSTAAS